MSKRKGVKGYKYVGSGHVELFGEANFYHRYNKKKQSHDFKFVHKIIDEFEQPEMVDMPINDNCKGILNFIIE